jgi:cobalamin biosynthesis Mg chelatase CobN
MDISKLVTEGNDAIFQINKPGKDQFLKLQNDVENVGLKHSGYFVVDFNKEKFKEFVQKEVAKDNKVVFLFPESHVSEGNMTEVKEAVDILKDTNMQVVIVFNTHKQNQQVPNSEISYFNSKEDLMGVLNQFVEKDDKKSALDNINSLRDNAGNGSSKPKFR